MSKKFVINISIPGEERSCSFEMKTNGYIDKKTIETSIKEEFLSNPEEGLINQIAKTVSSTFGLPTADEMVDLQPMVVSTNKMQNICTTNQKGCFYKKFMAGDNVWCEINHDGDGGFWLHIGNSHEGHPSKNETAIHFIDKKQLDEFCEKLHKD